MYSVFGIRCATRKCSCVSGSSSGTPARGGGSRAKRNPTVFVSLQIEKSPLRDLMLNNFVRKKDTMTLLLRNPEEMEKLKRYTSTNTRRD